MNTTEYEAQCLQLDKELADLLGWTNVRLIPYWDNIIGNDVRLCGNPKRIWPEAWIPRWTQDDAEVFRLMVEYDVTPIIGSNQIVARYLTTLVNIADFSSVLSAVRFAIVQAVVNKLKGN